MGVSQQRASNVLVCSQHLNASKTAPRRRCMRRRSTAFITRFPLRVPITYSSPQGGCHGSDHHQRLAANAMSWTARRCSRSPVARAQPACGRSRSIRLMAGSGPHRRLSTRASAVEGRFGRRSERARQGDLSSPNCATRSSALHHHSGDVVAGRCGPSPWSRGLEFRIVNRSILRDFRAVSHQTLLRSRSHRWHKREDAAASGSVAMRLKFKVREIVSGKQTRSPGSAACPRTMQKDLIDTWRPPSQLCSKSRAGKFGSRRKFELLLIRKDLQQLARRGLAHQHG